MRSLKRNKQCLYYATYKGKNEVVDDNDNFTGEHEKVYSAPVPFDANISAGKGSAGDEAFGKNIDFTRSISTTDMSMPIDEFSLIWFETEPILKDDGSADPDSADYTVAAPPARSLNSLLIALKSRKKSKDG